MSVIEDWSSTSGGQSLQAEDFRILSPLLSLAGKYGATAVINSPGDDAFFDSDALHVVVTTGEKNRQADTSAVSITCGEPCKLMIMGANRKSTQTMVESLSSSRSFPPRLASQIVDHNTWRSIRAGNRFGFVDSNATTAINQAGHRGLRGR